jgi:hypothetical protein
MKRIAIVVLAAFGIYGLAAFAAPDADAHGRSRVRVGVHIGAPWVVAPWPYYYHRPYYYDPYYYRPMVIREQPVVYVEQQPTVVTAPAPVAPPAPAPQAQQQQYWYFCQDTQTYYPHVQNCATPWQRVIPHATR